MARDMDFDGWWEGIVTYTCDYCGKKVKFRFDDEESAKNHRGQRNALKKKRGWIFTTVNGRYIDTCGEDCRNSYIRKNTI